MFMAINPFKVTFLIQLAITWLLGSATALAQTTAESSVSLKLVTMDLPPYGWIDEQGQPKGIIYELTEEIGKRSGLPYTHKIKPFSRMLLELKHGKVDLLSSQAHDRSLNSGEKLAVQFYIDVIAATKKGSGITTIPDFKGKNLIYHSSAFYPQLDGLPKEIQYVKGYRQLLQTLHVRSDSHGGVFSEPAYYFWMKDLGLTTQDFGNVITIEEDKPQWIFVRRDFPEEQREKIQKIVQAIYAEGMYQALLVKYGKGL